ncbi:M48 family metalloprotease [Parahaliea aestuarii]|uniref:M48 family metalloprotease n=1 Tax=Parahaliea aestuarii TaxID=1852021 RepID=A0A5C8ZP05_9GAMM|nr:M48 family metalloprotease [Parahaliea aestuarii]TXS89101.1 M48 family metalloprotease [Parahaliea aestuarii]
MRSTTLLVLLLGIGATVLLAGCASSSSSSGGSGVVVTAGGRQVTIEDESDELYVKMMEEGAAYDDPEIQAYVERIGQRLVAHSDQPDDTFIFTVIDSPDINAFATPGGYIYVNRGLLAYLDNEAELAGVLSHEIAHVTANHHGRQKTGRITNQVVAVTAAILTGSRDVADASSMYGQELLSGYGREHELEADGLGAEYMHKAGYDAQELLEVIGVLKDQEQYQRVRARSAGKPSGTYHGLYATHPRNDQRLQTVIRTAGELDDGERSPDPIVPGEFKQHMDGLVFGPSIQGQKDENRFYHNKLAFTFAHPEGWTVNAGSSAIVATAPGGSANLTITIARRDASQNPEQALRASASGDLSDGKALEQAGLTGYSAVASSAGTSKRLAVIDYKGLNYQFEGAAGDFAAMDKTLLEMIESFRPLLDRERQTGTPMYIRYIQVPRGATFASIASSIRIPDAEAQLRLLNGFYPRGEPRTGDWIKVIQPGTP